MMMYHQTKFGCQGINREKNMVERIIFWSHEPSLWPWPWRLQQPPPPKKQKQICMILWLIMIHHNAKFGNKMFGGLEDIIWTNSNIVTIRCDLDPECSNPIFFTGVRWCFEPSQPQRITSGLLFTWAPTHNDASQYQVWKQNVWWFRRYHLDKH